MKSVHGFLKLVAKVVATLTVLCLAGFLVYSSALQSSWVPTKLANAINVYVSLPERLQRAKEVVEQLPLVYVATPEDFEPVNTLEEDVHILTTYSTSIYEREIALINLRTEETIRSWNVPRVWDSHARIMHPIMLGDSSIIYGVEWAPKLVRVDKNNEVLWEQKSFYNHHGKNLGLDSTLWVCGFFDDTLSENKMAMQGVLNVSGKKISFMDNSICQIDLATGELLYQQSVLDILVSNGLSHFILKSDAVKDPFHLNDIQPVLQDGPYAQAGDLYLSGRNGSWVILYRPSTNEVINIVEGPFYAQHDVDIETDSTLLVFNNNTHRRKILGNTKHLGTRVRKLPAIQSQLVRYNLRTEAFSLVENEAMLANEIFSNSEGLMERLPWGGYFVEEQNSSVLWVLKDGEVLYKNVLASHHEGYHHLANWARIIQPQ